MCSPFSHLSIQPFHPSIQTFVKWILHSLFLIARKTEFKEYVPSVCCFQGNGFVWERAWPTWSCFYSWPQFYKNLPEICGWPKGPWHHPSCQWVSCCATFLPALFHSYLRNVRSSDFFSDVVFNSLSSAALFTCFPSSFLRVPALTSPHLLCNFTAEMYLLSFILCNIHIGHQICK